MNLTQHITPHVLDRERVATSRNISRYVVDHANFNVIDREASGMLIELISEVLTEHVVSESHTVSFDVPATWWQHFKMAHMRRFAKRYPIRYVRWNKTVVFNAKRVYPNADIVLPPMLGKSVIYETVSESDWKTDNDS